MILKSFRILRRVISGIELCKCLKKRGVYILLENIYINMNTIPHSLRTWFLIHFWTDILFALPLLFFPTFTLTLFGFPVAETLTPRIVAAAFIGIGGTSLYLRNKGVETYDTLLTLKIIWSVAAMVGIILALIEGTSLFAWAVLGIYLLFFSVWVYYKRKM